MPSPPTMPMKDPKVAIRNAFDAIRRELEDHARRRRQDVKTHTAS
ncbi:hypothetical protein [Azospirillum argentinense]